MAHNTFANGREIAGKAAGSKTVAAFPDVCFTPAPPPPGVPVPYPNTGFASDTANGSTTVKIGGKPAMLRDKSYFKTSTGDEAGSAPKKGAVTSKIKEKIYFTSWSLDVVIEGKNVVRHLDMTTHNHGSQPGNSPIWAHQGSSALPPGSKCSTTADEVKDNCKQYVKDVKKDSQGNPERKASIDGILKKDEQGMATGEREPGMCSDEKCKTAMKCVLTPYSPSNCCDGKTPHHIVPKSQFHKKGKPQSPILTDGKGASIYNPSKAPCICVDGYGHSSGKHGEMHTKTNQLTSDRLKQNKKAGKPWTVADAEDVGSKATASVLDCNEDCIKEQVREMHGKDIKPECEIRPTKPGTDKQKIGDAGL